MEEDKKTDVTQENTSLEPDSNNQASNPSSLEPADSGTDQNGQPIASMDPTASTPGGNTPQKPGGFKAFFHKINLYLLLFVLVALVGVAVVVVSYLNSKKEPTAPSIVNQALTQDQLKQLANSSSTIGDSGQTLTIQGSAIINGQELVKGDLDIAGNLKLGGNITAQDITASGNVNLAQTQIQKLQIANGLTVKGNVTLQNDLNVAGASSFKGTITAGTINASTLIISGNGQLQVPNHIAFPGSTPGRASIDHSVLGGAGGASVSGSDTTGTINVNTGSGTSAGCFITINFHQPFANSPHVLITPIGSGAGGMEYYVNRSNTQMSLCSANALPEHSRFAFDYFITD